MLSALLRTSLNTTEAADGSGATLADLRTGDRAVLRSVGGERAYRRRLLELGLLPGSEVEVVRVAELGGMLELEVRGSRLSLRIENARAIQIEREAGA